MGESEIFLWSAFIEKLDHGQLDSEMAGGVCFYLKHFC